MRSNLSKKNPYWIPRERYLELKHMVRRYWDYVNELRSLYAIKGSSMIDLNKEKRYSSGDVPYLAIYYEELINYIDKAAFIAGGDSIGSLIIWVIENSSSYDKLAAQIRIPCGRRQFYQMYRKFFWVLDQELKGHPLTQNV